MSEGSEGVGRHSAERQDGAAPAPPEARAVGTMPASYPSPGSALAAAPPTPKRLDWRRGAILGLVVAVIAGSGLAVLTYVGWRIGPLALTVGIVAALVP